MLNTTKLLTFEDAGKKKVTCSKHILPKQMVIKQLAAESDGIQRGIYECPICKHKKKVRLAKGHKIVCMECNGEPLPKVKDLKELWTQPKCSVCKGMGYLYEWI